MVPPSFLTGTTSTTSVSPQNRRRGWSWTAAIHPEDLDGLAAAWQRIVASGQPGEAEARIRRFDGAYRWFLFRANPLRDESGNIVKWYGTNLDIEDRKRGEDALSRQRAVLAADRRQHSWPCRNYGRNG